MQDTYNSADSFIGSHPLVPFITKFNFIASHVLFPRELLEKLKECDRLSSLYREMKKYNVSIETAASLRQRYLKLIEDKTVFYEVSLYFRSADKRIEQFDKIVKDIVEIISSIDKERLFSVGRQQLLLLQLHPKATKSFMSCVIMKNKNSISIPASASYIEVKKEEEAYLYLPQQYIALFLNVTDGLENVQYEMRPYDYIEKFIGKTITIVRQSFGACLRKPTKKELSGGSRGRTRKSRRLINKY